MSRPPYYSEVDPNCIDVEKCQDHFFVDTYYTKYKNGEYKLLLDKDILSELQGTDQITEIKKYLIMEIENSLCGNKSDVGCKMLKRIK
jgi:uncharacterized protein (DUF1499 family)